MDCENRPIGFFDSGVGGISVLKEAVRILPNENFIYFGDSKNAPYGTKTVEEVKNLSFNAAEFLISKNVKALVVACNTATSAAIRSLRERYKDIPVIGIEPALKPAVELKRKGKIIIMATPMTLAEQKFADLMKKYENTAEIQPVPCPELVEFVENGIIKGREINAYLSDKLGVFLKQGVAAIVLGCTHYPFAKEELKGLAKDVPIIDGSIGTVKHLKRELNMKSMLSLGENQGTIEIYNSLEDYKVIELSEMLLKI